MILVFISSCSKVVKSECSKIELLKYKNRDDKVVELKNISHTDDIISYSKNDIIYLNEECILRKNNSKKKSIQIEYYEKSIIEINKCLKGN